MGFPPPSKEPGARPVTNIRNLSSRYWWGWLKPEWCCLVPATSFCEWTDARPKRKVWFATGPELPVFAFAGIWRPWTGARGTKANPVEGEHMLFSFLTTEASDVVRPVHAKAMPVVLAGEAEWKAWLTCSTEDAFAMQRPAHVEIVASAG